MTNDEIIKKLEEQLNTLERVQKNAERLRNFQAMVEISVRFLSRLMCLKRCRGEL